MTNDAEATLHQHGAASGLRKWFILVAVWLGFVIMALNWFNISVAFPQIGEQLQIGIPQQALLISVFLVGVGLFHVPAGLLATRLGLRAALTLGLAVEGAGAILSALAADYVQLLVFRLITGVGVSIYIDVGIAAVTVWFRDKFLAFALGVLSTGYSLGTTFGLYQWAGVTENVGWRLALAIGGGLGLLGSALLAAVYKAPPGNVRLTGVRLTGTAVRQTLGNRQLWLYGVAFMGAYGAFFAASQMFGEYGASARQMSPEQIAFAMLSLGLAGIPGSVLGGWLSDRFARRRAIVLASIVLQGLFLLVVPVFPPDLLWVLAAGLGFVFNGGWTVWQCIPGDTRGVNAENIGTAIGLMLSVTAVGGFAVPYAFGHLVADVGYLWGWIFLGAVSIVFAGVGLVAREPRTELATTPGQLSTGPANL